MSDDKSKAGGQDRLRINVNEPYELRDWAAKLQCTHEELRTAVKQAGVMAKDVEAYLKTKK